MLDGYLVLQAGNAAMKELVASIYVVKQEEAMGENDKIIMNRVVAMYWIYSCGV